MLANVHPTYTPPANVEKVPGAEKIAVQVIVENKKKDGNEVSYKRDGFGIRMAAFWSRNGKQMPE